MDSVAWWAEGGHESDVGCEHSRPLSPISRHVCSHCWLSHLGFNDKPELGWGSLLFPAFTLSRVFLLRAQAPEGHWSPALVFPLVGGRGWCGDRPRYVAFTTPLWFRTHLAPSQPRCNTPIVNTKEEVGGWGYPPALRRWQTNHGYLSQLSASSGARLQGAAKVHKADCGLLRPKFNQPGLCSSHGLELKLSWPCHLWHGHPSTARSHQPSPMASGNSTCYFLRHSHLDVWKKFH